MKTKKVDNQNDQPSIEELEPRILFSAGLEGIVLDSLTADGNELALYQHKDETTLQPTSAVSTEAVVLARQELVFIDTNTPDYQKLVNDLLANNEEDRTFHWVLIDSNKDGIQQITDSLANYNNLDAVHIISHGSDGTVQLGNNQLDLDSLLASTDTIRNWGDAFSEDGDLLFYGCNLAVSADGQSLINSLARLTGADVAASDDLTGNTELGGDWELEYRTGQVETNVAISSETQNNWDGVLAFSVNTNADTADANPGDGLAKDGSGNTSLRAAIEEANALGGTNSITLAADTYTLSAGDLQITSDITITGADADLTIIDGDGLDRVFDLNGFINVTITDVTITGGSVTGLGGGINVKDANTTLERVRITGNVSTDSGAGIHSNGGNLTITDSLIDNNTASNSGGGLRITGASGTLTNVTISGNTSTGNGGGIYNNSSLTLTNVTITGNDANRGGGLGEASGNITTTMTNTIVAGNTHTGGGDPDVKGSIDSGGFNLIGDGGASSGWIGSDQVGDNVSPINPQLGLLQDNGGPTLTHALLTGSPAINAGTGALAADQRGATRDANVDVGAYEYAANIPPSATNLDAPDSYLVDTLLNLTDIVITDSDSPNVTATLTLSDVAAGSLSTGTSGAVTSTYNAGTGVWTATGALADINALLAGVTFTPSAGYNSNFIISTSVDDGVAPAITGMKNMGVPITASELWLTTNSDNPSPSGANGLATEGWADGEVLAFSDPGLSFGSGTTNGTFTRTINFDSLAQDGNASINGIHHVGRDMTFGLSAFQLYFGDIIFTGAAETWNNSDLSTTVASMEDVMVFHPDTPGDYSQGTFSILVDDYITFITNAGVTLVEQTTVVGTGGGSKILNAGDLLISTFDEPEKIYHHQPGIGDTVLIDGFDIGVSSVIADFDLIETDTTIGGTALTSGQILISLGQDDNPVGGIATKEQDIFILNVTTTGLNTVATATAFLTGADVGLNAAAEDIAGLTLVSSSAASDTTAPSLVNNTGSTVAEGGTDTLTNTKLRYDDDQQPATSVTYNVTTSPTYGRLEFVSAPGAPITSFSQDDLDNNRVVYVHNDSENFSDSFDFDVNDGQGNSVTGQTFSLTISPVNDAPVNTVPGNQTTDEDTAIIFSTGSGNAIQAGDIDSGSNPLRVTLTATNGTMTLSSTFGLNFSVGTGTGNAAMTFTGTITNINAALEGMSFTPTLDYYGPADIQITTEDLASVLFGYDTVFGSSTTAGVYDKEQIATQVTLSQNGTLTSITAYMGGIANKKDIQFGLYADTAGEPGALLAESGKVTYLAGDGWFTIELPATALTAGNYWIGLAPAKEATLFYDASGGQTRYSNFDPGSGFADPWSGTYVSNAQQLSVFASFTPDGATAQSDSDIINITVNAINDAPTVNATASDSGTEDTDVVYTHAQLLTLIGAADVDDANSALSVAISNVTNGSLVMTGGTGGVGTTFTFTPTLNFVGNMTFDYQVSDDNAPTPATSAVGTATVAIATDNDAPTVNATASDSGTEDTDVVYTHAQLLTLIGAADVDDANAALSIAISNVTNGSLVMTGGTGGVGTTFTFTPTLNFVGNMTFDYQVSDDNAPTPATSAVGTATVAIATDNDAPTVNATASDSGTEDTAVVYTHAQLLTLIGAADADDANSALSVAISNVTNGSLVMTGGTGGLGTTFTFTPTLDFVGAMTFDYQVSDDNAPTPATSAVGTATVSLGAVNDAPTVNATASDTGTEDTAVVYTHAQLLTLIGAADVDDANAALSIAISNVTNGSLVMTGGTGGLGTTFTFTPTLDFVGAMTFDYQVSDDNAPTPATSAVGTATVTLGAVNDAPTVNATACDTGTEDTDVVYTHAQLLTLIGAADVDDANAALSIAISNVTNGSLVMTGGTGGVGTTFTFTPTLNFVGNMTFDYQVSDDNAPTPATSAVGTATVAIATDNDAPTVNATASDSGTEDTDVVYTHAQLLTLIGAADVDDVDANLSVTISNVVNGTVALSGGTGGVGTTFTFTPTLDFVGAMTFDYQVSDDNAPTPATSIIGTATVTLGAVNDAPTVNATAADTGTEDTAVVYTHAQLLTLIGAADVDDANSALSIAISNVTNGSLVMTGGTGGAGTTFTFTPTLDFVGAMTFDYQVSDDNAPTPATSIIGTATVTLSAVNDAPTVNATASDTGTEDTDVVYTHAQLLTLIGAADVDDAYSALSIAISNVTNGSLVMTGGTGGLGTTFTFTPTLNFVGNLTFDYQVSDDNAPTPATSAVGTATVTLGAVNDAPTVNATASDTGTEDTDVVYTHAQLLTLIGAADVDDVDANLSVAISNVVNGTVALSGGTGGLGTTFTFTPTLDFVGAMTFDYQVSDDNAPTPATSAVGTATVTLGAVNDAPTVNATASDTGTEDTDVVYTHAQLLTLIGAADVDDVDANLSVAISNVVNGTVALSGGTGGVGTTFTFTPTLNFVGNLTFDYQVSDDNAPTPATSAIGTATVTLGAVNDAPTVNVTASDTGTEDTAVVYTHAQLLTLIGAADVDDVDANLSVAISNVVNGTVALSGGTGGAGTTFTFTPTLDFVGAMTFDYQVSDDNAPTPATSAIGAGTVTLGAVNDAPTATNLSAPETYTEDTALNLTNIVVSDVDSSTVTVTLTLSDVAAGALSTGTSGAVTSTFAGGVWTASGAIADVNTLLAGVTFNPALNYNSNFSIATSVSDGVAPVVTGVKAMTGTAVNDAPSGIDNTVVIPEDIAYAFSVTDFGFADVVDGDSLQAVRITTLPASGTLTLNGVAVTAGQTITGADIVAGNLAFTPAANANGTGYASFTFQVQDDGGTANGGVDTDPTPNTIIIDVTAVNDAPTLTAPTSDTMSAGTTLVFASANGNALSIADSDDPNATVEVTLVTSQGDLTLGSTTGLTFTTGDGTQDASMTFTGTIAAINTALDGLQLVTGNSFQGNASLTLSINDLGNTGGPALTTAGVIAITVDANQTVSGDTNPSGTTPPGPDDKPITTDTVEPPVDEPVQESPLNLTPNTDTRGRTRAGATESALDSYEESSESQFFDVLAEKLQEIPADVLDKVINKIDMPKAVLPIVSNFAMWSAIDAMLNELDDHYYQSQSSDVVIANVVRGATWSLSAGFVAWILRGGSLIAAAMSSIPIWKGLDPLPIIAMSKRERKRLEEEKLVDKQEEDSLQHEIGEIIDDARLVRDAKHMESDQ